MRVPVVLVAVFLVPIVALAQNEPDVSPETSPITVFQDRLTCSQTGPSSWSCDTDAGNPVPVDCNIPPHEAQSMPENIPLSELRKACPNWKESDWNGTE